MTHTINKETLENAVQMKQGIVVHDLETLNRLVGDAILQVASQDKMGSINAKSAVEKVAKDQFEKDYGSRQISWVDYATKFSENLDGNPFLLDEMLADRLERS
jgi:hypothetical protein